MKLIVAVIDPSRLEKGRPAISGAGVRGLMGSYGKAFALDSEQAIRVRTGERDRAAP